VAADAPVDASTESLSGPAPDPIALHRADPAAWPFLLQTVSAGARSTCTLLLFADRDSPPISGPADRLNDLESAWRSERCAQDSGQPFCGGWFVYLGYETTGCIEPKLELPRPRPDLPDVHAQRCRGALIIDHVDGAARLVGEAPEVVAEMREALAGRLGAEPAVPPPALEIEVDELMVIESYAHVHHIVSNVTGRLRPDASPVDVIRAVFPGGTITGCPKVRCMEIIAELEQVGRGPYTGSMGYLGLDGRLDLNILIRSMWVTGREVHFRTGAGIVADSEPVSELAETEAKARGLLRALRP